MSTSPLDPFEWMRLPQTRQAAERARREVRRKGGAALREDARIASLEDALERSMAMNLALWELLSSKLELGPDALQAKLEEIELRGPDGKPTESQSCVSCGRANRAGRLRCYVCGDFVALRQASSFSEAAGQAPTD